MSEDKIGESPNNDGYRMTKKEAESEMRLYRKVFSEVRILKRDEIAGILDKNDVENLSCPCYSYWGKNKPCDNCISARAMETKKDEVKLEFSKDGVFQVISRYAEIDGEPCVMELLREFDSENIVDLTGEEKLHSHINGYYEKTYTDVLTGVYNRRFYEEELKNATIAAGVAMIDLDDFKVYNNIYGHTAGDAVLSYFASELKRNIRVSDKLIRYGGDEFLLIMPGVQSDGFEASLRLIMQRTSNIALPGYAEINLTSSMGATVNKSGVPIETAVKRADRLLYKAKSTKNMIVTDGDGKTNEEKNKATILIVDDSELNREILSSILSNEFNVIGIDGGKACMEAIEKYGTQISLILLDINMPEVSGFDVLKYMNAKHYIDEIPVITITGDESKSTIRKAYEMGVSDFINRPFDAKVVYRRVSNTINLYEKQRRLISSVASEIAEKEKSRNILVEILSLITEFRSGTGREHITNINRITELLLFQLMDKTDKYGLTKKDVYLISTASSLHDIGKVEVDRAILDKPARLTAEEFEKVKLHTVYGAEIVSKLKYRDDPLVKYAYQICLHHHEKYDGKGYPDGLKGDDIPIAAQVVSLADVYDALTAKRVYKEAYGEEEAMKMILNGECGTFNPLLLDCLVEVGTFLHKDEDGEIK